MKSKQGLVIAVILVALCVYFLAPGPPPPVAETPGQTGSEAPQAAPAPSRRAQQNGSSGTPAALKAPQDIPLALRVAGLVLSLAFADTAADAGLRQAAAHDLQMVYGHLDGHEIVSAGAAPPVTVKGRAITPAKLINFTGAGRYFPKALDGEIGYVANIDGHEALLVTDKVIDAYREALKRRDAQPAAYGALAHFIEDLNLLATKPIDDPRQMCVLDPAMASAGSQLAQISAQAFVQQFGGQQYRAPSLLEVVDGAQISAQYKGRLVAKVYAQTSAGLKDHMPPIIFDQGRWKFLIVPPPT